MFTMMNAKYLAKNSNRKAKRTMKLVRITAK